MLRTDVRAIAAVALFGLVAGCSKAPAPEARKTERAGVEPVATSAVSPTVRATIAAPKRAQPHAIAKPEKYVSTILGKTDVTVHGKPSCRVDFVYAGFDPEDLLWDGEACSAVTARLVDEAELQRLGKWQRLDDFEKRHVSELPGGKVLYVAGAFTASLYPVGTTRLSYEVTVAD
jgi:hypothetical protein